MYTSMKQERNKTNDGFVFSINGLFDRIFGRP